MLVFTHPSRLVSKIDDGFLLDHKNTVPICHLGSIPVYGPFRKQDGSQFCTFWNAPDDGGFQFPIHKGNVLEEFRREHGLYP